MLKLRKVRANPTIKMGIVASPTNAAISLVLILLHMFVFA